MYTAPGVLVRPGLLQHRLVEQRQDPGQHVRPQALQVGHALAGDGVEDALAQLVGALVG